MLLTEPMPVVETPLDADLTVNRIACEDLLGELREEWNRLAGDVPFRRWEWLEAWWRHFGQPGDELFLLCVRDRGTGRLVGLAPWYLDASTLDGRVIRFLGSGRVCSDYLTILAESGREEEVALRVADWMSNQCGVNWDALELDGAAADDAAMAAFVGRLEANQHTVCREAGLSCWRMALPADWDAYLKTLSKSRRERVRQLHRRQFDTGRAVVRRVETAGELQQGLSVLVDLHQRRRESLGQSGCFSEPRFESFLRAAAARFFDLGRLRLQWIELEGRPVAVQIDFAGGAAVYHYQSGIDPSIPRERPGWLGTSAALKRAIEEGCAEYDFLRGDEEYKSHWRAEAVAMVTIRIAGHSTGARVRQEMWQIQRRLKSWVKGWMGRE